MTAAQESIQYAQTRTINVKILRLYCAQKPSAKEADFSISTFWRLVKPERSKQSNYPQDAQVLRSNFEAYLNR